MKVLLITPWDTPCGIAEHSAYLKAAVEAADPTISVVPHYQQTPTILHPTLTDVDLSTVDLIHLDYHAALHSQWTPDVIRRYRQQEEIPVLVTYHDTGVPNSDQCKGVIAAANAAVVHEPFDDLPSEKTHYWRMGVPAAPNGYQEFSGRGGGMWNLAYPTQPVLGSIGFPFGWKNYDQLAQVTAKNGWALYLIAPGATDAQLARWLSINPHTTVRRDFVPRDASVRLLAGCDTTAFCYVCHNTGQSAAILQGIAARKPVIALATCRQFRAPFDDPLARTTVNWVESFEDVTFALTHFIRLGCVDPGIVALAQQERWSLKGAQYATLYHQLAEGQP